MGEANALIAVLAGGAGERMGGGKPVASLGGRPLIAYPIAAARAAELDVVVVAKSSSSLPVLDCETVFEPEEPRHPLCGMVAAVRCAGDRPVVAVGCDMPFLTGALLGWLAQMRTAAVAEVEDRLQPLLAAFMPGDLPVLEAALEERLPARTAVTRLMPLRVAEKALDRFGDPRRLCFNVNEVSDLVVAESWLAERSGGRQASDERCGIRE